MSSKLYIVTPLRSQAALYTYDFVFRIFFGVDFELILNATQVTAGNPVIYFGTPIVCREFSIPSIGYLEHDSLKDVPEIEIGEWYTLPSIFQKEGSVPFDLFASCFYLLARVEEYNTTERDHHGRFEFRNSLMSSAPFQGKPIIDMWLRKLGAELSNRFVSFQPKIRSFSWVNSFDIDIAYAYSNRSPMRVIAATGKNILNGNFKAVKERFAVLMRGKKDYFDTYDFQERVARNSKAETIYFFLLGNGGKMDRNISTDQAGFVSLIKHVGSYAKVGIHPSYLSGDKYSELSAEIGKLSTIMEAPTLHSRQHFLRLSLPDTYHRLIAQGISHDYSMGFAEGIGFRSGTCTSHLFFDLNENTRTTLTIHPLSIMEGTLRDYLKLNPTKALETMCALVDAVKEVEGTFVSLWHNDSLKDVSDNPWRQVYFDMTNYIKEVQSNSKK